MKNDIYPIIIIAIFFSSCAINYPALPEEELTTSQKLAFIYKTDQKDRRRVLFKLLTTRYDKAIKYLKIIKVSDRDSLRLSEVITMFNHGLVITDQDKFYAASVYEHGGGLKMYPDSAYFQIAYNFFKELYDKGYKKGLTKSLMTTSYENWQYELKQK